MSIAVDCPTIKKTITRRLSHSLPTVAGSPPTARGIVLESCQPESGRKLDLDAAVVMPDHVDLIYSPLCREDGWSYPLPEIMKSIKGRSARHINVALKRPEPVWQEECFDPGLRSDDSLVDRVE
jgi:REP element-mobilizing transposase RayT